MPFRHCFSSVGVTPRLDARPVLKNQWPPAVGPLARIIHKARGKTGELCGFVVSRVRDEGDRTLATMEAAECNLKSALLENEWAGKSERDEYRHTSAPGMAKEEGCDGVRRSSEPGFGGNVETDPDQANERQYESGFVGRYARRGRRL